MAPRDGSGWCAPKPRCSRGCCNSSRSCLRLTSSNPILGLVARWSFLGNDGYPSLPRRQDVTKRAPRASTGRRPMRPPEQRSPGPERQAATHWSRARPTFRGRRRSRGFSLVISRPVLAKNCGIPSRRVSASRRTLQPTGKGPGHSTFPFACWSVARWLRQPHSSAHWIVTRSNADALGALVFAHEQGTYREVHGSAPRPCPLCRWAVPAGEAPPPESTPHWILLDCPGPRVDGIPESRTRTGPRRRRRRRQATRSPARPRRSGR
jgi:hypothetical protein